MEEVDIEIWKVSLHHEAEVACGIADGTEEHAVEHLELIPQSHFHRGLNDGADKGSEAGVGILNVDAVASAVQPDRQHARRMNNLHRSIHGEVANDSGVWMLLFPANNALKGEVRDQILTLFERSFECKHAEMIIAGSQECCDLAHCSV